MRSRTTVWTRNAALILACWSGGGCADDTSLRDADTPAAAAGSGGVDDYGGGSGRSGLAGDGSLAAGGAPEPMCTEPLPKQPVVCGGQICSAPAELLLNNACVVPCCVEVAGVTTCGAKSTSEIYPAECTLLAMPDPTCSTVTAVVDTSGAMMFEGCCNLAATSRRASAVSCPRFDRAASPTRCSSRCPIR